MCTPLVITSLLKYNNRMTNVYWMNYTRTCTHMIHVHIHVHISIFNLLNSLLLPNQTNDIPDELYMYVHVHIHVYICI